MQSDAMKDKLDALLRLSHELGRPEQPFAILAEGNASARIDQHSFLVKASGASLRALTENDIVECDSIQLLNLFDATNVADAEVERVLLSSRKSEAMKKPSVEALFHAWLLTLTSIEFVSHAHSPATNAVLCSPRAREFAVKRLFPDEVVCCDVESVFVPYVDPGFKLAVAIRDEVTEFMKRYARPPRVILMANHGIITLGRTADAALSAMMMAEKAATIWLGAAALGGPVFMSDESVTRISGRPDEAHRRKMLNL